MGMRITKTHEGVQALKSLEKSLQRSNEDVKTAYSTLKQVYEGARNEIAHESDFEQLISDIETIRKEVDEPIETLSQKINGVAAKLEAFLNSSASKGK